MKLKSIVKTNKRGQLTGGLITAIVGGVAGLILLFFVYILMFNQLQNTNLLGAAGTTVLRNQTDTLFSNFTAGSLSIASQIPTVFVVAVLALIVGVIILIVGLARRAGAGSGGAGSL